jgi:hypothetical protein
MGQEREDPRRYLKLYPIRFPPDLIAMLKDIPVGYRSEFCRQAIWEKLLQVAKERNI